jgi:ribonuclease Z
MSHRLTITAFSTALYSTWIFVEDFRLLLDAGDGVCAGLLGKSRKIDWVAITHADRDHLTGLLQLQQLNAHDGKPQIFYPRDAAAFPAFGEFCRQFDPRSGSEITWSPIEPWQSYPLGDSLRIEALPNNHIQNSELVKSVSYRVLREKRKLKAEYAHFSQAEITALARAQGSDSLMEAHTEVLLSYAGDIGPTTPDQWLGSQILIHEATFLKEEDAGDRTQSKQHPRMPRRNQHSVLPDVLQLAKDVQPEILILNHFSSRYSPEEVDAAVISEASRLGLTFPVYVIPPGRIVSDLLSYPPAWTPI